VVTPRSRSRGADSTPPPRTPTLVPGTGRSVKIGLQATANTQYVSANADGQPTTWQAELLTLTPKWKTPLP